MGDESLATEKRNSRVWSRRSFLAAFLTLAAFLRLTRRAAATDDHNNDETIIAGRWLLKRSDLP